MKENVTLNDFAVFFISQPMSIWLMNHQLT